MTTQIKAVNDQTLNDSFDKTKIEDDESELIPDESAIECYYDEAIESILNRTTNTEEQTQPQQQPKSIKYDIMINRPNNYVFHEISFDDVDSYDFNKNAFIEVLKSPSHVHLYFDFDSLTTFEEKEQEKGNTNGFTVSDEELTKRFADVVDWLDSLTSVFGAYSIGGYTNSEQIHNKYHLRLYPDGGHFISVHVVYYQTCIKSAELVEIMKHTNKQGFVYDGVNQFVDPNVYKITANKDGRGGTQKFRHVLSNKIYTTNEQDPNHNDNKFNHGTIINNTKPSQQIIQIRGNEKVIKRTEWLKLFRQRTLKEARNESKLKSVMKANNINETQQPNMFSATTLDYISQRIELSDDEFDELLNNFEPSHASLNGPLMSFLHSPFDKERVRDVLSRWYNKIEHANEKTLDDYVDRYYQQENNNKWFYSLMKHIEDPTTRKQWLDKFKYHDIDEEATINIKDTLGISEMYDNDYRLSGGVGINTIKFLNDLKHVCVFIALSRPLFIVKDYDAKKKQHKLSYLDLKAFRALMESFELGKYYKDGKLKNVNGWMVYSSGRNKNVLKKKGYRFYDEDQQIFSIFAGYDYEIVNEINDPRIRLWLNHIKEVLANDDENVYQFILKWHAYILQNPDKHAGSALVFTGIEGCGKSIVSNLFSKLFGVYSEANITKIEDVCGKFNAILENKKYIVCNEMASIDNSKAFNPDCMKSLITEDEFVANEKNEHKRTAQNVASFVMISNNAVPIRISRNDRRYLISECSSKHANDDTYFKPLYDSLEDKSFMNQIYSYFTTLDISDFNPRAIPKTKAKQDVLDILKSPVELYIESTARDFDEKGVNVDEYYQGYRQYAISHGFSGVLNMNNFGRDVKGYLIKKRVRINGEREYRYFLDESYKQKVLNDDNVDIDFDATDNVHI